MLVDPVLDVGRRVRSAKQSLVVRVVFGEQQGRISVTLQQKAAQLSMRRLDRGGVLGPLPQGGFWLVRPPSPGVAKPEGREHVQTSGLRSAVGHTDADQYIARSAFRVLDENVEISIFIEDRSIQ